MAVQRPVAEDLTAIAGQFHFSIPQERMPAFQTLVEGFLAPYDRLDELQEPKRQPRYPRDGGAAPRPEENRLGAWAWRVRIEGADGGPLAGGAARSVNAVLAGDIELEEVDVSPEAVGRPVRAPIS